MKTMISLLLTFCLFPLCGMFNVADAAKVYVMGSPTVLPEYNNKLPVDIRIEDRPTYGYVLVELETTSAMNGYCTNAPLKSPDTSADLELLKSDNTGSEWSDLGTGVLKYKMADSYTDTICEFTVNVRSWDYGAWGKLKATLYKRTGTDANGNDVFKKAGSAIGTVPRDENGNHIADGWNNDFYPYKWKTGSSNALPKEVHGNNTKKSGVKNYPYSVPFLGKRQNTVDKETGPAGNGENGDGFTAFEEYRGFMTTQQATGYGYTLAGHTRTSPETKDVFYVLHSSMSTYGIGDAGTHHHFSFTEMHEACVNNPFTAVWNATHTGYDSQVTNEYGWINTNSDSIPDTEHVHALRIEAPINPITNRSEHPQHPDDYMGVAAGVHKPYEYSLIYIYLDAIAAEKQSNKDFTDPTKNINVPVDDLVKNVISHEVGHMVNLDHCSTVCINNHPNGCLMDPWMSKYSLFPPTVEHYPDYDLAGDVKDPESEHGSGRKMAAPPSGSPSPEPSRYLTPSNSSYTASPGDSHTANYSISAPYSSVYWYVRSPAGNGLGVNVEIDPGDGSLRTADMTYTFPTGTSDASGDYVITAYVYAGDATTIYEDSYTVTVSSSSGTPPEEPAEPEPGVSVTISPGEGYPSTGTVGGLYTLVVNVSEPMSQVKWYWKKPGQAETHWTTDDFYDGVTTSSETSVSFDGPDPTAEHLGTHEFRVEVIVTSVDPHEASYTLTVVE